MRLTTDFLRIVLVATALVPAAPAAVLAGQASDATQLTITVSDPSGARIADAAVVLTRASDERTAITASDGSVTLRGLATGGWTLMVTRDGFLPRQRPVVVQTTPVAVAVTLNVAGVTQTVLVEAARRPADQVQLDTAATGGTRLDIPVRELPASLTIVTQELMRERGVSSAMEATELAPGVTTFIDSGSIPGINARGFSSTNGSVSVTRDGIRQNTVPQSGRPLDTFMLDRVEILKGPASLLSGEGAIGASINYVTKEPRRDLEVDTLLSYGSWDKYRIGFGISVPLAPTLAARVDFSHADGGGYVERAGDKMQSAAASIRWTARPSVSLKASAVYTDDSIRSYYGTPIIDGRIDSRTRFINYNMRDNFNKANNNYGRLDADLVLPGGWTLHTGVFAATQDVHWRNFESVQFDPTTRRVRVASYFLAKRDDLLVGNQTDMRKNFTVARKPVDLVAGYLFQDNDQNRWTGGGAAPTFSVDPYNPAPIFDPGFPFVFDRDVEVKTHTTFAESRVGLTDSLKVVTGLRWERFRVDRNQVTTGFATKTYYPATGRIGVVYLLNPLASVYASNSRAVEPVTPLVSINATNMTFSLQPSRQWEAGTKATILGGRLDATAAYFKINKENILTSNVVDGVRLTQQIGEQMSQGVEVAVTATPASSFVLMADATVLNAEFVEFNENVGAAGIISRAGNGVAHVPAVVFNVTPVQRIGAVTVSATVRRVGERWRNNANTIRLEPYTLLSATISTRFLQGTRLTLVGRNLTDEIYIPRSNSDVSGRLGAPRSFEIQLTRVF